MTGGAGHLSLCKVKGSMTFTLRRPSVREPSIKSVGIPFTQSCSKSAWAYRAEAIKLPCQLDGCSTKPQGLTAFDDDQRSWASVRGQRDVRNECHCARAVCAVGRASLCESGVHAQQASGRFAQSRRCVAIRAEVSWHREPRMP